MKYSREEGSAIFKDAMAENRSAQNLSDPAHGQVIKLRGNDPATRPAPKPTNGLSI